MAERIGLVEVQIYEFRDNEDGKTYYWNASEGRRLAEERRAEIVAVYLADVGMTPAKVLEMCPELDREWALGLPGTTVLRPVLFVPHKEKHVLIDGWHRMYKAAVLGLTWVPAHVLTESEARRIRRADARGRPL